MSKLNLTLVKTNTHWSAEKDANLRLPLKFKFERPDFPLFHPVKVYTLWKKPLHATVTGFHLSHCLM